MPDEVGGAEWCVVCGEFYAVAGGMCEQCNAEINALLEAERQWELAHPLEYAARNERVRQNINRNCGFELLRPSAGAYHE